jgi:hypothetical protein
MLDDDKLSRTKDTHFNFNGTSLRTSKRGERSVRPRGGIVGGPQLVARQFVLLTVVHATGSKGLSGPDITTSSTLSTLAATEEGEEAKDDVSKTQDTDSGDESNDEALVLVVIAKVEVAPHITAVAEVVAEGVVSVGGGGLGSGRGLGSGGRRVVGGVRRGVGFVGRGPRLGVFLELPGGLIAARDITTRGAFLKSEGDVIRDLTGNHFNLRLVDAKSSRDDIGGETEQSLSNCVHAWERIPEEGDEEDRLTTVVVLEMDGTLREESGLVLEDFVEDVLSAILGDHSGDEGTVSNKIELWGPWMGMRGVETAWSKETGSD